MIFLKGCSSRIACCRWDLYPSLLETEFTTTWIWPYQRFNLPRKLSPTANMEYVCREGTQVQCDDTTDLIACWHSLLPNPFAHPALCHMVLLFPLFCHTVDIPLKLSNLLNQWIGKWALLLISLKCPKCFLSLYWAEQVPDGAQQAPKPMQERKLYHTSVGMKSWEAGPGLAALASQ